MSGSRNTDHGHQGEVAEPKVNWSAKEKMGGVGHLIKLVKKISKRNKNQGSKKFYILLELSHASEWGF